MSLTCQAWLLLQQFHQQLLSLERQQFHAHHPALNSLQLVAVVP
jgi:hypothetical protein